MTKIELLNELDKYPDDFEVVAIGFNFNEADWQLCSVTGVKRDLRFQNRLIICAQEGQEEPQKI